MAEQKLFSELKTSTLRRRGDPHVREHDWPAFADLDKNLAPINGHASITSPRFF